MCKYYYVCPRCGRCYKHYIPRQKTKCVFCDTVWHTRGAKGTRVAFSWTATFVCLAVVVAIVFFIARGLTGFGSSTEIVFDPDGPPFVRIGETQDAEAPESGDVPATSETSGEGGNGSANGETSENVGNAAE